MSGSIIEACFFFSSRRRHTRCSRDWSSDVCSSDLRHQHHLAVLEPPLRRRKRRDRGIAFRLHEHRSEERRVGKECRSRWWLYHFKKKKDTTKVYAILHYVLFAHS